MTWLAKAWQWQNENTKESGVSRRKRKLSSGEMKIGGENQPGGENQQ